MSVVVTVAFNAPATALENLMGGEHRDRLAAVGAAGRAAGCLHHQFVEAADGTLLAIDEWESAEAFAAFFADNQEIGMVAGAAGVTAPPVVTMHRILDLPDRF